MYCRTSNVDSLVDPRPVVFRAYISSLPPASRLFARAGRDGLENAQEYERAPGDAGDHADAPGQSVAPSDHALDRQDDREDGHPEDVHRAGDRHDGEQRPATAHAEDAEPEARPRRPADARPVVPMVTANSDPSRE